jgi:hypothetical protein
VKLKRDESLDINKTVWEPLISMRSRKIPVSKVILLVQVKNMQVKKVADMLGKMIKALKNA